MFKFSSDKIRNIFEEKIKNVSGPENIFKLFLEAEIEAGNNPLIKELYDNLFDKENGLETKLNGSWRNRRIYVFLYQNDRGIPHSERILQHIQQLLYYRDEVGQYKTHFVLTPAEVIILLYSAYLHDYGKLYWQILKDASKFNSYPKILGDLSAISSIFNSKTYVDNLNFDHWKLIEKHHAGILEIVLDCYIKSTEEAATNDINTLGELGFVKNIYKLNSYKVTPKGNINKKAVKNLLDLIKEVSINHRTNNYDQIKTPKSKSPNLVLLTALLTLGDCCDTDQDRINKNELSSNLNSKSSLPPRVLAYWLMFRFTDKIEIKSSNKLISIVIKYKIPDFAPDDSFFKMRSFIERDFFDPIFLKIINDKLKEDNKDINIKLRYSVYRETNYKIADVPIDDNQRQIINQLLYDEFNKIDNGNIPAVLPKRNDSLYTVDDKLLPWMTFSIYTTLTKLMLPKDLNTLYVLTLFWNYPDKAFSSDEIGQKTAIDENDVMKICSKLTLANVDFLQLIEGKYNLNKDRDSNGNKNLKLLMDEYKASSLALKAKIKELSALNRVSPFALDRPEEIISTGIIGLDDHVLKDFSQDTAKGGFLPNRCILVEGAPGTGKTTFGMQILVKNRNPIKSTAFLTFEENKNQLIDDLRDFGWDKEVKDIVITVSELKDRGEEKTSSHNIVKELVDKIDEQEPEILVIDSISRFREIEDDEVKCRNILKDFFAILKIRKITVFCLGENGNDSGDYYKFEEYLADGIVKLTNESGKRFLEIVKLRGQHYDHGKHPFKIVSKKRIDDLVTRKIEWLQSGINLFPRLDSYQFQKSDPAMPPDSSKKHEYLSSGIKELNALLLDQDRKPGGFLKGNSILVIGSPGTGKTLLGLYFFKGEWDQYSGEADQNQRPAGENKELNSGEADQNQRPAGENKELNSGEADQNQRPAGENKKLEEIIDNCLWVSFEGPRDHLIKSADGFAGGNAEILRNIANDCQFLYFPLARLNHDEFVHAILDKIKNNKIKRLAIDCISDLESTFGDRLEFKNFVLSFVRLISEKGVTSMLLHRVPKFFGSYERPGIEITSIVDTIISLKSFDIANRMKKGLFILKIRGREHKSELQTVEITKEAGLTISAKGWTLEGLISGESVQIKEPPIFFKLFYENTGERIINDKIIKEFNEIRYPPQDKSFTSIRKPQLYTEFWSFRGHYGAGHANIRVISLPLYSAKAFRSKGQLHDLTDFITEDAKENLGKIDAWKSCTYGKDGEKTKYDMAPNYADYSFICYQKEYISQELKNEITTLVKQNEWTWKNLMDIARNAKSALPKKGEQEIEYAFALPDLSDVSDFIAFFLEILWSYDGRISVEGNKVIIDKNKARNALEYMLKLVNDGIACTPYIGDLSLKSIFCRKRYSNIRILNLRIAAQKANMDLSEYFAEAKEKRKDKSELIKIPDHIGILPMPKQEKTGKSWSVYDLYTLGVVREALSPEIGWIFVDSLTHQEWVKKRAKARSGLPIRDEDIRNPEIRKFDNAAFELLEKTKNEKDNFGFIERGEIPNYFIIEPKLHKSIKSLFATNNTGKPQDIDSKLDTAIIEINKELARIGIGQPGQENGLEP